MSSTTRARNFAPSASGCSPTCSSRAPCSCRLRHWLTARPAAPPARAAVSPCASLGAPWQACARARLCNQA